MTNLTPIKLHEIKPRESSGRDTISRYQAQFRAAAYASLEILEGKNVDRIYCDFHDDFVKRTTEHSIYNYHFFQVKTKEKRNHQWSLLEIFGLYKKNTQQDANKVLDSFMGKLLIHTVNFKSSCGKLVFLTNIQFTDEIEDIISDLESQAFENKNIKLMMRLFNDCYAKDGLLYNEDEIKNFLLKIEMKPGIQYLNSNHDFEEIARKKIYKYSEIDLNHHETQEIVDNLVSLVEKKSYAKLISELTEEELDNNSGIGIGDLLDILSISRGAYEVLLNGGETKAIKSASILQRKLMQAGASSEIIVYCCEKKLEWDNWYRNNRHIIPEFDLKFLQEDIDAIFKELASKAISFRQLESKVNALFESISNKFFAKTISKDLLLGGVFSSLVRSESQ